MATRWTIRHSLMLLWFADLMNVTEEVTIHRPNVSTLLSSAFIRGDLSSIKLCLKLLIVKQILLILMLGCEGLTAWAALILVHELRTTQYD